MKHARPDVSELTIASFRLNKSGLLPLGSPTFSDWLTCGKYLRTAEQSVQFWIGDWLIYGETAYGKTDYNRAVAETGMENQTLRIYKYVASALPMSLRRNKLSFHHHKEVASLPPDTQARLLAQAEVNGWPLQKLRQEKSRLMLESQRVSLTADPGCFMACDPGLLVGLPDASLDMVLTAPDFTSVSLDDLAATLAVLQHKLKDNSHVYLFSSWQTYPLLFPLLQQHFTVKNLLVWEKATLATAHPSPYYQVYEFVLFAQKGRRHLNGSRDPSILSFPRQRKTAPIHPTEKPADLLAYLIGKSTQPGEVVCDPFMGAGGVCLSAKHTGRRYIGIESQKKWYALARKRLG